MEFKRFVHAKEGEVSENVLYTCFSSAAAAAAAAATTVCSTESTSKIVCSHS